MRDEFIAIASHELRTPLTSMKLHIRLALRALGAGPEDGRRAEDLLLRIDGQTNRIVRLVEDMLDSSSVASGKLSLRLERLDLGSIVRQCFDQLANPMITLEAPEGVVVSGDAYRLEQVVLNLLQNAIKYGQGSPVDARLASDGAFAVLEVTDRGIGIAPDSLARIFQKYERAVSIENISGLGLGLYISRAVVEPLVNQIFEGLEIAVIHDKAVPVRHQILEFKFDLVVVAVNPGALVISRESRKPVTGAERKCFLDPKHN